MSLQIEDANNDESEHANSSDADQRDKALKKMMEKGLKDMLNTVQQLMGPIMENSTREVVIHIFKQDIWPKVEDLISKVVKLDIWPKVEDLISKLVKEEIPLALEKFSACHNRENLCYRNSNETTASTPRVLELQFLDEVSDPVLTGNEIKGKRGTDIQVAVVDNVTGHTVDSGSKPLVMVEIFLDDNNADSIGRENDKTKPHFRKPVQFFLQKGIGSLSNAKLRHGANWMKSCKCKLRATVVGEFDGSSVKEVWTDSFKVVDSRIEWNNKHHPPSLDDDVWRLDNIGKGGAPCKRLHKANVTKVKDFLFLLSIDPRGLQKIVGAGAKRWEGTVNHAHECKNNDREMRVYFSSSSESINGVVFDVLVHLKGVLRYNNRFVPIEYANEAEKDEAKKLLASAFENQKDIILYEDETSLLHKYPRISNNSNATYSAGLDGPDDCNRSIGNIDRHDPTQPGTSYHGINPSIDRSNNFSHFVLGDSPIHSGDLDRYLDYYDVTLNNDVIISETNSIESHYYQRSTAGSNRFVAEAAVAFVRLFIRTRVRVESFGDSQVEKRQRRH